MDNKLASSRQQSLRALDSLNFFLADIQGGVGPFLVIFLTASLHWNPARVGLGIGAALSNLVAGFVVKYAGYHAAFLTMAALAGVALIFFWFAMPETKASLGQKTGEVGEQQA